MRSRQARSGPVFLFRVARIRWQPERACTVDPGPQSGPAIECIVRHGCGSWPGPDGLPLARRESLWPSYRQLQTPRNRTISLTRSLRRESVRHATACFYRLISNAYINPWVRRKGKRARPHNRGRALQKQPAMGDQTADRPLTREARRDILRAAVFLWTTPLVTPRISSG